MSRPVRRTITPNSLPALGKLCTYCENLDFGALLREGSGFYYHHESLDDLFKSATSGCGLCQLFRYSSEINPQQSYDKIKAGGRILVMPEDTHWVYVGSSPNVEKAPNLKLLKKYLLCWTDIYISEGDLKSFEKGTPSLKGLPQDPDSSSYSTFSKISSWLEECCTCHLSCERPTAIPLPSRVLDLSPPRKQRQIRLISGEGKRGQWVALSHAWGGFQPLRTTKETLAVHQAGIKWSELPPTFQDAVIITKTLGFKYLWIDSLCIIQNSPEDWDREAATMASVYGNAAITICAEAAANSQCGIFKSANNRRGIDVRLPANSPQNSFEYEVFVRATPWGNGGPFHIGDRAWVLQESLLSPRVIIYTADQVKWSCRTAEKFERGREEGEGYLLGVVQIGSYAKSLLFPTTGSDHGDDKLTRPLAPMRIEKVPFKPKDYLDCASQHRKLLRCWYDIVERYGPCNITKAEDRLPAIAGVAKRISALTGFSYLAGLWLEDIVQGLCWFSENGLPQTSSKYLGPTWSWVCMTYYPYEKHKYLRFHCTDIDFEVAEDIKIEDINIKCATADEFMQVREGSSLRITGLCCGADNTVSWDKDRVEWRFYMKGKPQFDCWELHFNFGGTMEDRKLTFLRLGQARDTTYGPAKVYLLILQKSPVDNGKYIRVGFSRVSAWEWKRLDLEFWSVQTVTII